MHVCQSLSTWTDIQKEYFSRRALRYRSSCAALQSVARKKGGHFQAAQWHYTQADSRLFFFHTTTSSLTTIPAHSFPAAIGMSPCTFASSSMLTPAARLRYSISTPIALVSCAALVYRDRLHSKCRRRAILA